VAMQQRIGTLSASPAGSFTVMASWRVTASRHVLVKPLSEGRQRTMLTVTTKKTT